jgi:L-fuconolactonase
VRLIDSQCHVSPVWYEPVESLLEHMTRNEVGQAVLLQMLGQTDNSYQQDCLKRFPGRFASVVLIDIEATDATTQLRRLAKEGATGIRLRPTARSAGPDPLALWRCAAEHGLAVSCVGDSDSFSNPEFARLIEALPQLLVVLEHLGGTSHPNTASHSGRARAMELSRYPNVFLKVPGLGELRARRSPLPAHGDPFESATPDSLNRAVEAFGAHRLMWGSDFPPVCSREGYSNALHLCRAALQHVGPVDLDHIFWGTASRVFKLPAPVANFDQVRR